MKQLGVTATYVDPMRPAAFAEAILPNTKLVWIETPTNPLLKLCDIAAVAQICQRPSFRCSSDNTFCRQCSSVRWNWARRRWFTDDQIHQRACRCRWWCRGDERSALHERLRFCKMPSGQCRDRWTAFGRARGSRRCLCGWNALSKRSGDGQLARSAGRRRSDRKSDLSGFAVASAA